jgi:multidrug efflux pump subunit AcrA (membrane-fusion protein)
MPATVRPALRAEAPIVADLLRRAGFGSTVGRLLDYPFAGEAAGVFVADEDGVEPRPVTLGHRGETVVEVLSGLEPGMRVASTNTFLLKAELGKAEAEHEH